MTLEQYCQCAVVDQLIANALHAAGRLQRLAMHEHAAARGRRRATFRAIHPSERVQHLKKEDEGGDHRTIAKGFAAQLRHQRRQDRAVTDCAQNKLCQHFVSMADVGIGK